MLLCYDKSSNLGFLLSIIIIFGTTIAQIINIYSSDYILYPLVILSLILFFFYWFQHQTKRYYLNKLRTLELESLHQELAEKDAQIQKLQDSNDELARIIHRDNKLIPAMESAVRDYLEHMDMEFTANINTYNDSLSTLRARGTALSHQLQEMTQERKGILSAYENQRDELPRTGLAAVDAILSYMHDRATMLHIGYTVKLSQDFSSAVIPVAAEEDLMHLLSDLIENAIIATRDCQNRAILIHLSTLSNMPTVEISDSGIPFEPAVYQDFGVRKHSTHLDNGGSGIGLLDIWELKKKYSASLHIYEYAPDTDLYTKKLSIIFDSKNHYLIRSYRAQEIVMLQARSDMFVLPLDN